MARSERRTLRYALLGASGFRRHQMWSANAEESVSDAEFERQIGEVCRLAREVREGTRRRDGARTIAATAQRIAARETALARRTALDLQRLDDLTARYEQRKALKMRQRWFVIGRIIDAAMHDDAQLRSAIMQLIKGAKLRRDERLCLDLAID